MQGRDQQCYHTVICNTFLWKHRKAFLSPVSILVFCKNTLLLKNKKVRAWETATAEDITDETYNGPGNVSKCTEMAWLCSLNPIQTQYLVTIIKEYKTLLSLPLSVIYIVLEGDSLEHTSRNCWTWWVSPHYQSHWTYYQVTQHLKVCCYEDTQICWKEKKDEVKQIVRSGGFCLPRESCLKTVFQTFLLSLR